MAAEVKHMLSENIKRLRAESGMSQEELAARLAVVRQTVSKWERGMSVPDADMVVRLAELFGVPVSELLGTQGRTRPPTSPQSWRGPTACWPKRRPPSAPPL